VSAGRVDDQADAVNVSVKSLLVAQAAAATASAAVVPPTIEFVLPRDHSETTEMKIYVLAAVSVRAPSTGAAAVPV
jgi:hypothetical protein